MDIDDGSVMDVLVMVMVMDILVISYAMITYICDGLVD